MLALQTEIKTRELQDFLQAPGVTIDVRSPGEFAHGRLPDAVNVPLFSNDERAEVGTCYKQVGPQEAIQLGLQLVKPKLDDFFQTVESLVGSGLAKIHCWRGGMRSSWFADFLQSRGLTACTLQGGYKNFRRWALQTLSTARTVRVLGGLTGSGKTQILHALQARGEQVIDLEALAHHRGSAYGHLGQKDPQPSNEQFENEIAYLWADFDPHEVVWIEDESRLVGRTKVPDEIYSLMQAAPKYCIERPLEERLDILMADYGRAPIKELVLATLRIHKKLGGARMQTAVALLKEDRLREAFALILSYYDKTYTQHLRKHGGQLIPLSRSGLSPQDWAETLSRLK